jgi:hypothetical protein
MSVIPALSLGWPEIGMQQTTAVAIHSAREKWAGCTQQPPWQTFSIETRMTHARLRSFITAHLIASWCTAAAAAAAVTAQ